MENFEFERALSAHLRNWPTSWQAVMFFEPMPKKGTVDIKVFFLHKGVELRCDYEIELSEFSAPHKRYWDRDDAALLAADTREFIELELMDKNWKL